MKNVLDRERAPVGGDSGFSSTMAMEHDATIVASWTERAAQVRAEPFDHQLGSAAFAKLWHDDAHLAALGGGELSRLAGYLHFVRVPGGQQVIAQGEQGDFLLVVLDGTIAVDRVQPWGHRVRLAEAHAGEMLGEMAMLDAGTRFSACTTQGACSLAVVDAEALSRMLRDEPRLAAALMAALSRRLSVRLRQVGARLAALLSRH